MNVAIKLLDKNKKIGIEVTTFITEHEAIRHKIISDKSISNESMQIVWKYFIGTYIYF